MPENTDFPFYGKKGWHIGPCKTAPEERGKVFYPLLLQHIIKEHPDKNLYMIIDENNISSQRGVAKVQFEKIAVGYKNLLGRYVINSDRINKKSKI